MADGYGTRSGAGGRASPVAMAKPIPAVAPVTITTLPASDGREFSANSGSSRDRAAIPIRE